VNHVAFVFVARLYTMHSYADRNTDTAVPSVCLSVCLFVFCRRLNTDLHHWIQVDVVRKVTVIYRSVVNAEEQ